MIWCVRGALRAMSVREDWERGYRRERMNGVVLDEGSGRGDVIFTCRKGSWGVRVGCGLEKAGGRVDGLLTFQFSSLDVSHTSSG